MPFKYVISYETNFEGGVYMNGFDFLLTSICFSILGYGLCYMTLSSSSRLKTQNNEESSQILHK